MAHAVRHSPGEWTLATPLAEAELDADAATVFERQLSAGQTTEGIQRLTRAALDSWKADQTEYRA